MRISAWLALLIAFVPLSCCNKKNAALGASSDAATSSDAPAAGAVAPVSAQVRGTWAGASFEGRSAYLDVHATWLELTIASELGTCASRTRKTNEMIAQASVPSGDDATFYAGKPIAVPFKLAGAGVAEIPAGHGWLSVEPIPTKVGSKVSGRIGFDYRTGLEKDAPSYVAAGTFSAELCSREEPAASMPKLDPARTPVAGTLAGHPRAFPSFLAFPRPGSDPRHPVYELKAFSRRDVSCFSEEPNTPFLFGAEIGPGPDADHFAGRRMPVRWVMQANTGEASERSIHASDGGGWINIASIRAGKPGTLRGSMGAATVGEDEPRYAFELSGEFEATICPPR